MLWIKAFHIIAMVAWFAGLFYLPRLFVYHADAVDEISQTRFKCMERRLYFAITWPAGMVTTILGLVLLHQAAWMQHFWWMQAKEGMVALVWTYHLLCGHFLKQFKQNRNSHKAIFYRFFNEVPTVLLVAIVILIVVK